MPRVIEFLKILKHMSITQKRDPKVDPKPGDMLAKDKTNKIIRTITARRSNEVDYRCQPGGEFTCRLRTWQHWSYDAVILKIA